MRGVLEELHQRYYVETEYIDIRENPDIAREYGIRFTPALIMFNKAGEQIAANTGILTVERIVDIFASHNVRLQPKSR